ncbi:hypothetical protein KP13_32139 [Klebsiella pneumoniae subsp. pneumoniae Kp13]|nr:hypothetical protein KP13_32139 [Klebsiella pneumoniae subsp. pneumoniae Kp13]
MHESYVLVNHPGFCLFVDLYPFFCAKSGLFDKPFKSSIKNIPNIIGRRSWII